MMQYLGFSIKKLGYCIGFLFLLSVKTMGQSHVVIKNEASKAFLKTEKINQEIKLDAVNLELLEETLFHLINAKSKVAYCRSEKLDFIAAELIENNRNSFFSPSYRRAKNLKKDIRKRCKTAQYPATFIETAFDNQPLLDFQTYRKYRFDKETETFVYPLKNRNKKTAPIPYHTYLSLADRILREMYHSSRRGILSGKEYEDLGLSLAIEQKSNQRMPYLKVLVIAGGYRLKMLKE